MTSDVHIGLRVPTELEQAMRLLGERADRSFSAEVRRALWRHVELEAVAHENDNARPTMPSAVQSPAKSEPVHGQS